MRFFKDAGLGKKMLVVLFLTRVLAGFISGYINLYYYQGTDISGFHLQGIEEYHLLFQNPAGYFTDIFHSNHGSYGRFLESSDSYWNDTRSFIIVKMLSVFNIFSGTQFFINSLFYNFFIFWGTVALFRVFIRVFPSMPTALIIGIFLLPSVIYFSSAIHRDGLIYLSLSMIIYHLYGMLHSRKYTVRPILIIVLYLLVILLLRNFVFIILVPALIGWILAERMPKKALAVFASVYAVTILSFFLTGLLPEGLNLPAHFATRQRDFIEIAKKGVSAIDIHPLYPAFSSFLANLPQAVNHGLMRPYLTEHNTFLYVLAAAEICIYEMLLVFFLFFRLKRFTLPPIIYFSLFLSLPMCIVIGYTIPILGAIVRYRSIYLPFMVIPLICYTDWNNLRKKFI